MDNSLEIALKWMGRGSTAALKLVEQKDVSKLVYYPINDLENCDIYCVLRGNIGASEHIAIPNDSRPPFSLGFIGE